MILKRNKVRQKYVAMECIDHKKANDKVPQYWIVDCLEMHKISNKVINLITEAMKNKKVELTAGGKILAVASSKAMCFCQNNL